MHILRLDPSSATYLPWGFFSISVPNAIVIAVAVVLFILAIALPFPRDRHKSGSGK